MKHRIIQSKNDADYYEYQQLFSVLGINFWRTKKRIFISFDKKERLEGWKNEIIEENKFGAKIIYDWEYEK